MSDIAQTLTEIVDELADAERRGHDDRVDSKLTELEGAIEGARSLIHDDSDEQTSWSAANGGQADSEGESAQ